MGGVIEMAEAREVGTVGRQRPRVRVVDVPAAARVRRVELGRNGERRFHLNMRLRYLVHTCPQHQHQPEGRGVGEACHCGVAESVDGCGDGAVCSVGSGEKAGYVGSGLLGQSGKVALRAVQAHRAWSVPLWNRCSE